MEAVVVVVGVALGAGLRLAKFWIYLRYLERAALRGGRAELAAAARAAAAYPSSGRPR